MPHQCVVPLLCQHTHRLLAPHNMPLFVCGINCHHHHHHHHVVVAINTFPGTTTTRSMCHVLPNTVWCVVWCHHLTFCCHPHCSHHAPHTLHHQLLHVVTPLPLPHCLKHAMHTAMPILVCFSLTTLSCAVWCCVLLHTVCGVLCATPFTTTNAMSHHTTLCLVVVVVCGWCCGCCSNGCGGGLAMLAFVQHLALVSFAAPTSHLLLL